MSRSSYYQHDDRLGGPRFHTDNRVYNAPQVQQLKEEDIFEYRDNTGKVYGPFPASKMIAWTSRSLFPPELPVRIKNGYWTVLSLLQPELEAEATTHSLAALSVNLNTPLAVAMWEINMPTGQKLNAIPALDLYNWYAREEQLGPGLQVRPVGGYWSTLKMCEEFLAAKVGRAGQSTSAVLPTMAMPIAAPFPVQQAPVPVQSGPAAVTHSRSVPHSGATVSRAPPMSDDEAVDKLFSTPDVFGRHSVMWRLVDNQRALGRVTGSEALAMFHQAYPRSMKWVVCGMTVEVNYPTPAFDRPISELLDFVKAGGTYKPVTERDIDARRPAPGWLKLPSDGNSSSSRTLGREEPQVERHAGFGRMREDPGVRAYDEPPPGYQHGAKALRGQQEDTRQQGYGNSSGSRAGAGSVPYVFGARDDRHNMDRGMGARGGHNTMGEEAIAFPQGSRLAGRVTRVPDADLRSQSGHKAIGGSGGNMYSANLNDDKHSQERGPPRTRVFDTGRGPGVFGSLANDLRQDKDLPGRGQGGSAGMRSGGAGQESARGGRGDRGKVLESTAGAKGPSSQSQDLAPGNVGRGGRRGEDRAAAAAAAAGTAQAAAAAAASGKGSRSEGAEGNQDGVRGGKGRRLSGDGEGAAGVTAGSKKGRGVEERKAAAEAKKEKVETKKETRVQKAEKVPAPVATEPSRTIEPSKKEPTKKAKGKGKEDAKSSATGEGASSDSAAAARTSAGATRSSLYAALPDDLGLFGVTSSDRADTVEIAPQAPAFSPSPKAATVPLPAAEAVAAAQAAVAAAVRDRTSSAVAATPVATETVAKQRQWQSVAPVPVLSDQDVVRAMTERALAAVVGGEEKTEITAPVEESKVTAPEEAPKSKVLVEEADDKPAHLPEAVAADVVPAAPAVAPTPAAEMEPPLEGGEKAQNTEHAQSPQVLVSSLPEVLPSAEAKNSEVEFKALVENPLFVEVEEKVSPPPEVPEGSVHKAVEELVSRIEKLDVSPLQSSESKEADVVDKIEPVSIESTREEKSESAGAEAELHPESHSFAPTLSDASSEVEDNTQEK